MEVFELALRRVAITSHGTFLPLWTTLDASLRLPQELRFGFRINRQTHRFLIVESDDSILDVKEYIAMLNSVPSSILQ